MAASKRSPRGRGALSKRARSRPKGLAQLTAEGQLELKVSPDHEAAAPDAHSAHRRLVAAALKVTEAELAPLALLKRSIDARRGRVEILLLFQVGEIETYQLTPLEWTSEQKTQLNTPRSDKSRVLIVGDGPAGLFCAFRLAQLGIRATVIERGKQVQPRRKDLKLLNARGGVDSESNYCFGEGGAGTYSDGKLYTRSHKRGSVRDILETLYHYGAPAQILTDARPHIGSNLLPKMISAMREDLEALGVEFLFETRFERFIFSERRGEKQLSGAEVLHLKTGKSEELQASALVLATGHSARDVYRVCVEQGVLVEAKPFALGVRVEHPQEMINEIQYGRHAHHPQLGAASYRLVEQVEGRGVFSFCMCPGGWIVPASTDAEHLVVNGMSLSKRDSPFANSGMVVAINQEDWLKQGLSGPFAALELQARAEAAAQVAGGGENRAPALRIDDFLKQRISQDLPKTSYLPGLTSADVGAVLDATGVDLAQRLRRALSAFAERLRGFDSAEGIIVGVESRTSAPLRILRDSGSLQSPSAAGVYPAGEGAGYAGGIISAAVDGVAIAEKIFETEAHRRSL